MASPRIIQAANVFEGIIGSLPLVTGDLVYNDGVDWELADASAATTRATAFVAQGGGKGATGTFSTVGIIEDTDAPYTINNLQYLSETAGAHTATVPTAASIVYQVVGMALSTSQVYFNITPPNGDNDRVLLGADADLILLHRAATLAANTTLGGVIVGTPVIPAIAANSVILANLTNNGDVVVVANKGGNSFAGLFLDGSTGDTLLLATTGQSIDLYIAGTKEVDYSAGLLEFQQDTIVRTSSTFNLTISAGGKIVVPDDKIFSLGTDSDQAVVHRSTSLAADTALTGVLVGTPVTPDLPANSLIISNTTTNADILLATSKGGNSRAGIWLDGSAHSTEIFGDLIRLRDSLDKALKLDYDVGANRWEWQQAMTISTLTNVMTLTASQINVTNGTVKLTMGTASTFATTQPTNTIVFREGTAPAGAITTASGLFASATVLRKIIADGTVSNVET